MSKASTRALAAVAVLGVGTVAYVFGSMDGSANTPAGQAPPSVAALDKAKNTGLGFVHIGNGAVQGITAEAGSLTATAGNAAASAGGAAANAVPAPPK
jgi:hypothetical protein